MSYKKELYKLVDSYNQFLSCPDNEMDSASMEVTEAMEDLLNQFLSDPPNGYSIERIVSIIQKHYALVKDEKARTLLQDFIDISSFDDSDPRRAELPALKSKAKKLLGNQ